MSIFRLILALVSFFFKPCIYYFKKKKKNKEEEEEIKKKKGIGCIEKSSFGRMNY
jgi:hypothetical protein